jgi:hemerythrin
MKWTPALATGEEAIDAQHRELFRCLADLQQAATEGRTLYAVYTLTRLKHYVRDHFAVEEALLRDCKYPKLAVHRKEHRVFQKSVDEFQVKCINADVTPEMVVFLTDWLTQHIAGSDLDYVPYLKQT